jgi:hypothetical protein
MSTNNTASNGLERAIRPIRWLLLAPGGRHRPHGSAGHLSIPLGYPLGGIEKVQQFVVHSRPPAPIGRSLLQQEPPARVVLLADPPVDEVLVDAG